ncbi:LLM class flavin-dependent oxidoreductase [Planctomonas sp. JC2975]|uniref:LLM class flavin-dependent oxidoreductase n=1 Tax=Planctomonas sp. JC2975 TaxID=2729626 RepID=UPI001472E829|nr:LLM class flavin-dependent oxidoreductase [Planctomonas sp. JC2975]NNC11034.1 LLM class flavin-dependent oxidoreductase [Planctomonas sp. JC2975]
MTTRDFRFGSVLGGQGTAARWAEIARTREEAGYAAVLVPDTLATPSPFLALAAAASATTSIRLGTWVLSAPLRRPAEVVREASTLQQLSDGRLELGVGAGRPGGEYDAAALGATWGGAGERVSQVEATLEAVRDGVSPAPSIVVAAHGERMLRLAGRFAGTVALPAPPTADLIEIAELAKRARSIGGGRLELALQITGVGDDIPDWLTQRLGLTTQGLRDRGVPTLLSGDVDTDLEQLEALRATTGISYLTVTDEYADRLAPLVGRASGR